MDKLIEKLIAALSKVGLDETVIQEVVAEVTAPEKEVVEEVPAPAGDPTVPPTEGTDGDTPKEVVNEEVGDVPPSADPSTDDVPPTDGDPSVPPEEVTPSPALPPAPAIDPELVAKVGELENQLSEQVKANEGLLNRVAALEEALKNAGVIDSVPSPTEVGDTLPSAAPQSPTDDVFGNVLNEINGHKRF